MKRWLIILSIGSFITVASALLNGCRKNDSKKQPATILPFVVPSNFPQPVYNFNANPLTKEGVQLGQKLFYEGKIKPDPAEVADYAYMDMSEISSRLSDNPREFTIWFRIVYPRIQGWWEEQFEMVKRKIV